MSERTQGMERFDKDLCADPSQSIFYRNVPFSQPARAIRSHDPFARKILLLLFSAKVLLLRFRDYINWGEIFGESLEGHRFSAYWLRSKCSICSTNHNRFVVTIVTYLLSIFGTWRSAGACSSPPRVDPVLHLPPGTAHPPKGGI